MSSNDDVLYLHELMADRERLGQTPGRFKHVERLVDQEIYNVRSSLFDGQMTEKFELPMPIGDPTIIKERVYIPDYGRKFNFVGRLLGPRGKTLKRIEQDTGCKIMIRGEGSTRPPRYDVGMSGSPNSTSPTHNTAGSPTSFMSPNRNGMSSPPANVVGNRGPFFSFSPLSKANATPMSSPFQHHSMSSNISGSISASFANPFDMLRSPGKHDEGAGEPLHVLIQCEDTPNRAHVRMQVAKNLITKLFQPVDDAHDELKRKQLLELSFMNGTFKASPPKMQTPRKQWPSFSSKSPSFSFE